MTARAEDTARIASVLDRCRGYGVNVVEVAGARTRGHGQMGPINGIVCHHTAGAASGDYPSLAVVRDGRPGLRGPLSQFGIGRDGTIYWIASGVAYHAGVAQTGYTNTRSWGIEAENTGRGEAWGAQQMHAYRVLCRELAREWDLPFDNIRGHKEVALPLGRKTDPAGIDMGQFRTSVAALDGHNHAPSNGTYTVVKGDTLWSIARRFGLSTSDLIYRNGGSTLIRVGQVLHNVTKNVPVVPTVPKPAPKVDANVLSRGDRGAAVMRLQMFLNKTYPAYSRLGIDGKFGPATERVVKECQRRLGVRVDGAVGPIFRSRTGFRG